MRKRGSDKNPRLVAIQFSQSRRRLQTSQLKRGDFKKVLQFILSPLLLQPPLSQNENNKKHPRQNFSPRRLLRIKNFPARFFLLLKIGKIRPEFLFPKKVSKFF